MKQTAVEWLSELLECGADLDQIKKCIPKAKEIENEQKNDLIVSFEEWRKKHPLVSLEEPEWQLKKFFNALCRTFIADTKASSATRCICGKEKWEHPIKNNL